MTEIYTNSNMNVGRRSKKRAKRHSTHIDMTPMVDLMSLLITFFMLTTAFAKPRIMEIILPDDTGTEHSPVPKDRTLNILLSGNDKIYYYIGKPPLTEEEFAASSGRLNKIDYGDYGIRKLLLKKNMLLYEKIDSVNHEMILGKTNLSNDSLLNLIRNYKKKDKVGPIVMIKADKTAKYRNIVDVIDEMAICNVARYAVVNISKYEQKMLEAAPN